MINSLLHKVRSSKTATSSIWVAVEMMLSQLIRLLGNLVLTRLLIPEYFGIVSIVMSIITFIWMMCDVGLVPSIVNSERDKDPVFMETAWTIQVIRGFIIAALIYLLSDTMALVYDEPIITPLLKFTAICIFIEGFTSIALVVETKYLRQKRQVIMRLGLHLISILVIIALAYIYRSVWALVAGNLVRAIFHVAASYIYFSPHFSRFRFDKEAFYEVFHFGKWILLASLFGYFTTQEIPIIGMYVTMEDVGIFVIAATFATIIQMVASNVSDNVLQPKYRQLINEHSDFKAMYKVRNLFNLIFLLPSIVLAVFGDWVIQLLYDPRYISAGWMLQLLAVGKIGALLTYTAKPVLISLGDSRSMMFAQIISALITITFISAGAHWGGLEIIVLATALAPFGHYLIMALFLKRHGVGIASKDMFLFIVSFVSIVLMWLIIDAEAIRILNTMLMNR